MDLVLKAILMMMEAHHGQTRNDRVTPYFVHPMRTWKYGVESFKEDELPNAQIVQAAYILHDTPEDASHKGYTIERVAAEIHPETAQIITWVTKPPRRPGLSISEKLRLNMEEYLRIGNEAPDTAIRVKVSDRMDNLSEPDTWTDGFRKFYLRDTQQLLDALNGRKEAERISTRLHRIVTEGLIDYV